VRDLQVQTPAPGFLTGSHPKVVRHHGQLVHTVPPREPLSPGSNPGRNAAAAPSPPRPAPAQIFTQRDHPPDVMSFLYGFKAAPRGRSRRRHAALASVPAGTPATAAPTPVGWRERRNAGRSTYSKFIRAGGVVPAPAAGIVRGRSEPVKALCDRRTTAPAELPGERTREDGLDRTCPDLEMAAIGSRDTSGQDRAR